MTTPNLLMPELSTSQAQKEVTYNDALRVLDALVQAGVQDKDLTAPPAHVHGNCWIVAAGATGAWVGQEGKIAQSYNSGWFFLTAKEGWRVWVNDENLTYVYNGSTWSAGATVAGEIVAAAEKSAPVDADNLAITDSAASHIIKKVTWANIKATITTALGAMINSISTAKTALVNADLVVIADTEDSNASKKVTWTSIKAFLKTYFDTLYPGGSGTSTGTNTGDETTTRIGDLINGATAKTALVNADLVVIADTEASNIAKKTTWTSIKAFLKSYFDTLYTPIALGMAGGVFSRNTQLPTPSSHTVSGLPFQPRFVFFYCFGTGSNDMVGMGADAGGLTTIFGMWRTPATGVWNGGSGTPGIKWDFGSGNTYAGLINTFTSDGFIIDWTRAGSPEGVCYAGYIAFR